MKYTIFCRLGMVSLALSLMLLVGCEFPTTYIEISVEVPMETATGNGAGTEGGCECETVDPGESGAGYCSCPEAPEMVSGCTCPAFPDMENCCNCPEDQPSAIVGFTFTQTNPIRAAYSVRGRPAGRFSDPIGGTPPFHYALVVGDGFSDADNGRFTVSGDSLKIQADHLSPGVYCVHVGITDGRERSYSQAVTVTIAPDPIVLDQETRTVQGIDFNMRYVSSGAFLFTEDSMGGGGGGGRTSEVSISQGFWIAETEVTQKLYQAITGQNPSVFWNNPAPGEIQNRRPVDKVYWHEAILFCNKLSVAAGKEVVYQIWGVSDWEVYLKWAISVKSNVATSNIYIVENANGYRLPTADEWVWAYIGADIQNPGQVNTDGVKKAYAGGPEGSTAGIDNFVWVYPNNDITHEVGKKYPNELNLYDMTGNVSEWVWGSNRSTGENLLYDEIGGTPSSPVYSHYQFYYMRGFRIACNE
jgi:formylglycine-generating enzyme required for sulfatase activity